MLEYLKWNDIRSGIWGSTTFTWSEVAIIVEIQGMIGGSSTEAIYDRLKKEPKQKKKKIISIIAKLEGKEYKESKERSNKKIEITIKDVEILVEKLNINVNV